MDAVFILEEAHEDLISIVARLSLDNPAAAQKLGNELLDLAQRQESMPYRGSSVKKAAWPPQADPWLLPSITGLRTRRAWSRLFLSSMALKYGKKRADY